MLKGRFLPTPHYYEETWVSYAARHKGWKVMYFGEAVMEHEWHQASKVGGEAERTHMPVSRQMFRDACDHFGIERD
jgi:GT2 family glycosyltransferase